MQLSLIVNHEVIRLDVLVHPVPGVQFTAGHEQIPVVFQSLFIVVHIMEVVNSILFLHVFLHTLHEQERVVFPVIVLIESAAVELGEVSQVLGDFDDLELLFVEVLELIFFLILHLAGSIDKQSADFHFDLVHLSVGTISHEFPFCANFMQSFSPTQRSLKFLRI